MTYEPSSSKAQNAVHRLKDRARYDEQTVFGILDKGNVAHVTFKLPPSDIPDEDFPVIIPMIYGRIDDKVYLHGHLSAGLLKALSQEDVKACVSVTLVHGLVVSLTPFHNSNNYSSVVLFGHTCFVSDATEKDAALTVITNHQFHSLKDGSMGDRWADSRTTNETELKSTRVVAFQIESASAKLRSGPPKDEQKDIDHVGDKYWCGHLIREERYVEAVPAPYNKVKQIPQYIQDMLVKP